MAHIPYDLSDYLDGGGSITYMSPMAIVNKYHEEALKHDPVNKPAHYNNGGIECIDYIEQTLGKEGFKAYCIGNCVKYLHRHEYKGKPEEDLRKAAYYLNKAISTYGTPK